MFERFTDRARRVMARANKAALELGHADLTPQHVLIGILHEGGSSATAMLDQLEVDREALLERTMTLLRGQTSVISLSGKVTTHAAKGIVEDAIMVAQKLGVDHVGSEHLLLAVARAQTTPASQVLADFSVTGKRLTAVLRGMMQSGAVTTVPVERVMARAPHEQAADGGLAAPGACPLCDRLRDGAGTSGPVVIAESRWSRVYLGENQGCPGWCVLVLKSHVEHLDELSLNDQAGLFREVAWVARALLTVFPTSGAWGGPPRINYECLGNQVGHIHWHVIPRHAEDPDPRNAVWGWPAERLKGAMTGVEREALAEKIQAALEWR